MTVNVPFVDLRAQHEEVRSEIEDAIKDIVDRSRFIGGEYVAQFEKDFAEYLDVKYAVGVNSGTDALWLGLIAAGIKENDAVITVPNTFIATVEAITRSGAQPIFIDIDLESSLIDLDKLQEFLENECIVEDNGRVVHKKSGWNVAAIMPVHLYGCPVNMEPLLKIAQDYHLIVIEDACQAHGAKVKVNGDWKKAGTLGLAAGFSFYPGKNLGAMGDAGALVTNDAELAEKIRWMRDHGSSKKYIHETPLGWNSRLDSIQAAVLSAKLKKLDKWNGKRREAATYYREVLSGLPIELPIEPDIVEHVYHLYVIRHQDREKLQESMSGEGIGVALHYPIPLHLQKAYSYLNLPQGSYPNTEESASTLLSLPMHQNLSREQVEKVGRVISRFVE
jgi:dTDP-4-amino-4,6-dideoxygalactose transaminase